jgi:hypothetical protein
MNKFSFLFCATLVGCSLSQEKFETDAIDLSCTRIMECTPEVGEFLDFEDVAGCVEVLTEMSEESEEDDSAECTYDAAKAQSCLDEIEAATCEEYSAGDAGASCEDALDCEEAEEETEEESTEEVAE